MSDIHELLEETRQKLEKLTAEAEAFGSAKRLHYESAESLKSLSAALEKTQKSIEPFTLSQFQRFRVFVVSACVGNSVLLLVILYFLVTGSAG